MVPVNAVEVSRQEMNPRDSHLRHTTSVSEAASQNVTQVAKVAKWESGNCTILSVATHRKQNSATAV